MSVTITSRDFVTPTTDAQNIPVGTSFYDPVSEKDYFVAVNDGGGYDMLALDLINGGPLTPFAYDYQLYRTEMTAQIAPFVE